MDRHKEWKKEREVGRKGKRREKAHQRGQQVR
jgi:hypothetical protein